MNDTISIGLGITVLIFVIFLFVLVITVVFIRWVFRINEQIILLKQIFQELYKLNSIHSQTKKFGEEK